ncbi:MAG: DUF4492 domain-containing protein [Duncaniella sp.]|nr:DUF4492 domain-containing protein [Duncaniella sp.]
MTQLFSHIYRLYYDGFRNMTIGRTLWAVIIVKLVVIFAVLKLFFFPDLLADRYDTDEERADAVREALIANP